MRCEEARVVTKAALERLLAAQKLSPTKPAAPSLIRKLQAALDASTRTPLDVKRLLVDQGLVPGRPGL